MKTKTILSLALILTAAGLFGMGSQAALYTAAEDLVDKMIAWSKECVGKTDVDCSRNLDALRKTAFKAAEFPNELAQDTTDDKSPDGDAIGNGKAGWKAHWRMYQQLFIYHGKCFNRYDAKECREMWVAQDKERTRIWHLYGPEPRWRDFPDALRHRTFKPIPTKRHENHLML